MANTQGEKETKGKDGIGGALGGKYYEDRTASGRVGTSLDAAAETPQNGVKKAAACTQPQGGWENSNGDARGRW